MSSVRDRLHEAITARGMSLRAFQMAVQKHTLEGGRKVEGGSYPAVHRYLQAEAVPSVAFLEVAAEVLAVRPEWLAFGSEPRTTEELDLARKLSEMAREEEEDDFRHVSVALGAIDKERQGRGLDRAGLLHAAVLRFARKLRDAEHPGAPWAASPSQNIKIELETAESDAARPRVVLNATRLVLLEAAARFIIAVDESFALSGRQRPDRDPKDDPPGEPTFWNRLLLERSDSIGWNTQWYDAVLQAFSIRVMGLGERTDEWLDAHGSTLIPRLRAERGLGSGSLASDSNDP